MGVNDSGHGIGGIVESIDELEAQGNQQRQDQEKIRHDRGAVKARKIRNQVDGGIGNAHQQHPCKDGSSQLSWRLVQF
jgi:hypothetical protein